MYASSWNETVVVWALARERNCTFITLLLESLVLLSTFITTRHGLIKGRTGPVPHLRCSWSSVHSPKWIKMKWACDCTCPVKHSVGHWSWFRAKLWLKCWPSCLWVAQNKSPVFKRSHPWIQTRPETKGAKLAMHSEWEEWHTITATLAECKRLWGHVCGRGWISISFGCVTLPCDSRVLEEAC